MIVDIKNFWHRGYLHLKDVFKPDEVLSLREKILKFDNDNDGICDKNGCMLSNSQLARFVKDDKIISIATQILGGVPVYFGDSNYTIHEANIGGNTSTFHKDNTDRYDSNAPDWETKYTIIRFAIYFQNHNGFSNGIALKPRSHNVVHSRFALSRPIRNAREIIEPFIGKSVYLPTEIGDVGVWNLRATHAGDARSFKFMKSSAITKGNNFYIPEFMKCPAPKGKRVAMFITFGLDDHHLARYIDYMKTRTYYVNYLKNSSYPKNLIDGCAKQGFKVKDMHQEIMSDISSGRRVGQFENWNAFPY